MKVCKRISAALLTATLMHGAQAAQVASSGGTNVFIDVLDTPAAMSPLAAHGLFNGLAQAGGKLVAVGQRGFILTSVDGGQRWKQARVPLSADLVAVQFSTPSQGWAVGHDGVVLHSTDGGATWQRQLDGRVVNRLVFDYYQKLSALQPNDKALAQILTDAQRSLVEGPDKPFLDVWFENEQVGFVVGAFNLILYTEDGGRHWTPWMERMDNPKAFHLYAIRAAGKDLYAVGEQGLLLKLDRTTGRFTVLKSPYNGTFFGVLGKPGAAGKPAVALVYGLRGNVFRSTDSGASWSKVETGQPVSITGGTVTADGRIVLVNQAGTVLVSRDDGVSFQPLRGGRLLPASAVAAVGGNVVIAGLRGMRTQPLQ